MKKVLFTAVFGLLVFGCFKKTETNNDLPPLLIKKVILSPDIAMIVENESITLTATAIDQNGNPIEGIQFEWRQDGNSITMTPGETGSTITVRGSSEGWSDVSVSASMEDAQSVSSIASIFVFPGGEPNTLKAYPQELRLAVGESRHVAGFAYRDTTTRLIKTPIRFTTSSTNILLKDLEDQQAVVTGLAEGEAEIWVESGTLSQRIPVTVVPEDAKTQPEYREFAIPSPADARTFHEDFVLLLDRNNHPHFLFADSDLYHATWTGTGWDVSVVEKNLLGNNPSAQFAMALLQNDTPAVAYTDYIGQPVYATYDPEKGSWNKEIIRPLREYGLYHTIPAMPGARYDKVHEYQPIDLSIDENNQPHIAYTKAFMTLDGGSNDTFYLPRYAYMDGSEWKIEDLPEVAESLDKVRIHVSPSNGNVTIYSTIAISPGTFVIHDLYAFERKQEYLWEAKKQEFTLLGDASIEGIQKIEKNDMVYFAARCETIGVCFLDPSASRIIGANGTPFSVSVAGAIDARSRVHVMSPEFHYYSKENYPDSSDGLWKTDLTVHSWETPLLKPLASAIDSQDAIVVAYVHPYYDDEKPHVSFYHGRTYDDFNSDAVGTSLDFSQHSFVARQFADGETAILWHGKNYYDNFVLSYQTTSDGVHFSPPKNVNSIYQVDGIRHDMKIDGNRVYIAFWYNDGKVMWTSSEDRGQTFSTLPREIIPGGSVATSFWPQMEILRNGNIAILTSSGFWISSDHGQTWNPMQTPQMSSCALPRLSFAEFQDGTLGAFWFQCTSDPMRRYLHYSISSDGGNTWTPPAAIEDESLSIQDINEIHDIMVTQSDAVYITRASVETEGGCKITKAYLYKVQYPSWSLERIVLPESFPWLPCGDQNPRSIGISDFHVFSIPSGIHVSLSTVHQRHPDYDSPSPFSPNLSDYVPVRKSHLWKIEFPHVIKTYSADQGMYPGYWEESSKWKLHVMEIQGRLYGLWIDDRNRDSSANDFFINKLYGGFIPDNQ